MNLEDAARKHSEWKVNFFKAIATKAQLDAGSICRDDRCELGKWLHGAGKASHGQLPGFPETVKRHSAFHAEAGKVATAINAGQFDAATKMLSPGTRYTAASTAVVGAIQVLRQQAG